MHTLVRALFVGTLLAIALAVPTVIDIPTTPPSSTFSASLDGNGIAHFHYLASAPVLANPVSFLSVSVAPTSGQNPNFQVYVQSCSLPGYTFDDAIDTNQILGGSSCESDSLNGCTLEQVTFCRASLRAPRQAYVSVYGFPGAGVTVNVTELYSLQSSNVFQTIGITEVQVDDNGVAFVQDQVFYYTNFINNQFNGSYYGINTTLLPDGYPRIFSIVAHTTQDLSSPDDVEFHFSPSFGRDGPICDLGGSNNFEEPTYGEYAVTPGCGIETDPSLPLSEVFYFQIRDFANADPLEFSLWIPPTPPTITPLTDGEETSGSVRVGQISYFSFPSPASQVTITVTPENNSTIHAFVSAGTSYPSTSCPHDDDTCEGNVTSPCSFGIPVCIYIGLDPSDTFGVTIGVQGIFANGAFDPEATIQFTIAAEESAPVTETPTELPLFEDNVVEGLELGTWHDFVFHDIADIDNVIFFAVPTPANGSNETTVEFDPNDELTIIVAHADRPYHSECPTSAINSDTRSGTDISAESNLRYLQNCLVPVNSTDLFVSVFVDAENPNITFDLHIRVVTQAYIPITLGTPVSFAYNQSTALFDGLATYFALTDVSQIRGSLKVTLDLDQTDIAVSSIDIDLQICSFLSVDVTDESPNNRTAIILTDDSKPYICPDFTFLLAISSANTFYSYSVKIEEVDTFDVFTPGDSPLVYSFASVTEIVEFNVAGLADAGLSIAVEARGQSPKNGLYPFSLTLLSPTCQKYIKNCPGDAEPCFLTVPYAEWGEDGKWLLLTAPTGAVGAWVNISLGTDNCRTVYPASSDYCQSEGIQTTSVFTGFTGISNLDYFPNLFTNLFDGLPDASDACLAAAKAYQCNANYASCDDNGWVPARGTLCLQCRDFAEKCAASGACLSDAVCDEVCAINGSEGTLPTDGGDGGDGNDGGDGSSSASSLKSFSSVLL